MDTMEEGPNGALYRLVPNLSLHKPDDHIVVSYGPCWSPDGRICYFADGRLREIWACDYDLDTGAVSHKRTFCKIDASRSGAADGSTVDAEGCLWTRASLRREDHPLHPKRRGRAGDRHAGEEGDQA